MIICTYLCFCFLLCSKKDLKYHRNIQVIKTAYKSREENISKGKLKMEKNLSIIKAECI